MKWFVSEINKITRKTISHHEFSSYDDARRFINALMEGLEVHEGKLDKGWIYHTKDKKFRIESKAYNE